MKKVFTVALVIIAVVTSLSLLTACSNEEEAPIVVDYEIESNTYFVGDTFDTSKVKVTANMSDDTTLPVDSNLFFTGNDKESLNLDEDGKFLKADTYKVNVYLLVADDRENNRFLLGEWELIVKAKK
ncbi:MAG TPA: hypothetical protein VJ903_00135 [Clostridia bacterium]|nr:hypothetical protein [Clostridia bacterium]